MTTMRQLIKGSLRLLNAVSANEEPTDEDMNIALASLNGLVDSLGNDILNIYTVQPYYFPLTPGQQFYTLGPATIEGVPTGADWMITRPMRIEQARLLLYPTIAYPTPPGPTNTCAYVCSEQDDATTDLWHFDEPEGSTVITAAVFAGDGGDIVDISEQFALSNTCCTRGIKPTSSYHGEISLCNPYDQTTVDYSQGFTHEFLLYRDDADVSQAEIFRADIFQFANGEGLSTLRGYREGNELVFYKTDIFGDALASATLEPGCNAICIQGTYDGYVSFYVNGQRIFHELAANIWTFYSEVFNIASFIFFCKSGSEDAQLTLDEFRRSNVIRYDGETYEYLRGV